MKTPNINCKIELSCSINPSEDLEKIKKAILNIFSHTSISSDGFSINAESKNLNSLEKIFETIHSNRSQKTYARNLENNLKNDSTWFFLNKQTAFVGKIVVCDEFEESPLGPIKISLTSPNIDGIIDWLVFGNET